MVPHSWILETLQLMGIAPNIQRLVRESMGNWKTTLTSTDADLGEVRIRRDSFQGDSLSPLLFCYVPDTAVVNLAENEKTIPTWERL